MSLSTGVLTALGTGLILSLAVPATSAGTPKAGLGKVLTTKDGGEIFGFDINQVGDDGVLASGQDGKKGNVVKSVETFDQNTGKIVKSFATTGKRDSYSADGIFAGDVGLSTHYIVPKGTIYAKREYELMNPVTANAFTGAWTPPVKDIDVQMISHDQTASTSTLYAIELKKQDAPILIVSDVAANTFSKVIHLDPNTFSLGTGPQLGQYTAANQAYIGYSPDGGAVGGKPPVNALIDLSSGKVTSFDGYNNGFYHAGSVNGATADPNTGVAVTDTELNAQVEFYDLNQKSGIAFTQLPCTGDTDQSYSGSGIAVDPVNKLFLVTETYNACSGGEDSALVVFDEAGNVVESITGFKFFLGEPSPVINPSKRMGWAFGGPNGWSQLQQFFY